MTAASVNDHLMQPPWGEAWRAFLEAHRRVVVRIEEELERQVGIPLPWFDVMSTLAQTAEGRCRMQDLAQTVLISKSGLTRLVDRMERAGLVERQACEDDRRGTFATLTESGLALYERCAPVYVGAVTEHFADLLDEEQALVLADVMSTIAQKAQPDV